MTKESLEYFHKQDIDTDIDNIFSKSSFYSFSNMSINTVCTAVLLLWYINCIKIVISK